MTRWWEAEDTANDNIGKNHGALQNGASFAAGKVGQAFSFDGVDDYVSLPPNSETGDFTIEFWEKSSSNALYKVALSFAISASKTTNNLIFDFNDPDLPGGVGLWVYWNGTGENRITTGSIGSFTNGQWHHIALTRLGTNMTLYVNGLSVGSTVYTPSIDLANFDANNIGAAPSLGNFWEGAVDEVSIYNRALTAKEVADLYNASSAGKCKACIPPTVTFNPVGPLCMNTLAVDLSSAVSPPGGIFAGPGISGGMFNPAAAGAGTHLLTYTFTDANNCTNSASQNVVVNTLTTLAFNPVGPFCVNNLAIDLTSAVSPSGGTFSGPGMSGSIFNPSTVGVGTHTQLLTLLQMPTIAPTASARILWSMASNLA